MRSMKSTIPAFLLSIGNCDDSSKDIPHSLPMDNCTFHCDGIESDIFEDKQQRALEPKGRAPTDEEVKFFFLSCDFLLHFLQVDIDFFEHLQ